MLDCVTSAGPAITPATAASAVPTPNTSMKMRPTLWPRCPTMCGCVSAACTIKPDPRLLQDDQQRQEDGDRHQQHEHLVGGIVGGEDGEGGKVKQRRNAIVHRAFAPDDLHDFLDREGQAEREQQFRDVAVLMDVAQAVAFDGGADRPASSGATSSAGQKPNHRLI